MARRKEGEAAKELQPAEQKKAEGYKIVFTGSGRSAFVNGLGRFHKDKPREIEETDREAARRLVKTNKNFEEAK